MPWAQDEGFFRRHKGCSFCPYEKSEHLESSFFDDLVLRDVFLERAGRVRIDQLRGPNFVAALYSKAIHKSHVHGLAV